MGFAIVYLGEAAVVGLGERKFLVGCYGVVDFDAVGIVAGELGVRGVLKAGIGNAIDYG